jgi:hypothetical protein
MCAASDRLGRVLLLDVADMTVLRLFKVLFIADMFVARG